MAKKKATKPAKRARKPSVRQRTIAAAEVATSPAPPATSKVETPKAETSKPSGETTRPKDETTPRIIPKKVWCAWSGRQHKVLDEQAERYGIPLAGATIDLAAVAMWIHDLLAIHGRRIRAGDAAAEIWDEGEEPRSPALERKREVEYQLRLRDLAERDGELVSREKTRQGLAAGAGVFKQFADTLQRQYGADALDLWNDALADWERAIEQLFGGEGTGDREQETEDER